MTVQTEIVNLTTATTSLLNEVITKKSVLDEAADKATAALDATKVSEAAAKASEIAAKTSENNAKAEANRAKSEADRAKQISGLDTVAEAVGLAALPLPDVSIPFTTDGQLLHGKGAPVLVGTTPVAQLVTYERLGSQTMIDKSGRLVTVPAGEMAFEQQGLAIFDQSVNLAAPSINFGGTSAALNWANGAKTPAGWITLTGSSDPAISNGSYKDFIAPTSGVHTFSLDILKTAGLNCRIRVYDSPAPDRDITIKETTVSGTGSEAVSDAGEYWRVELTVTLVNSARPFRIYPFGAVVGASGSMTYRRVQLEAKPFATPYIENATSAQTTRPATTRCDVPWPGNMQPIDGTQTITIALEFDTKGSPIASNSIFASGGIGGQFLHRIVSLPNNQYQAMRSASGVSHTFIVTPNRRYKMCYRINKNTCDLFVDGVKIGQSVTVQPAVVGLPDVLRLGYIITPERCLNGHLRNINIWNSSLTDIQCQAASS